MMNYKVFRQGVIQTNCTVLEKGNNCIVVDVAYVSNEVENYINTRQLNVVAVLLTHGHFDHCGGTEHLKRACNCKNVPVYVHSADEIMCKTASQNRWGAPAEDCQPTHNVCEGRLVLGDFSFDVLEVPGHTQGSVVYICDDIILGGDLLFKNGVGRTDLPEGDHRKMCQSVKKVLTLPRDYTVIPGHGESTTISEEKRNNVLRLEF